MYIYTNVCVCRCQLVNSFCSPKVDRFVNLIFTLKELRTDFDKSILSHETVTDVRHSVIIIGPPSKSWRRNFPVNRSMVTDRRVIYVHKSNPPFYNIYYYFFRSSILFNLLSSITKGLCTLHYSLSHISLSSLPSSILNGCPLLFQRILILFFQRRVVDRFHDLFPSIYLRYGFFDDTNL